MSDKDRSTFIDLQKKWTETYDEYRNLRIQLENKYGPYTYFVHYSVSENKKLESLSKKLDRIYSRMHKLLEKISPRDWRRGISTIWIMTELTYEDAVTDGPLSKIPEPAFGFDTRYTRRFAEDVAFSRVMQ
jgi:hypothetical protein